MNKITETKSVFLYGKPTQCKKEKLLATQKEYIKMINHFIEIMIADKKYYLDLFNNRSQTFLIRLLEKTERIHHCLGSAYGQNAIDHAVTELHNHFTRIKKKMYGFYYNQRPDLLFYIQSIALFNACIQDEDELDALNYLITAENSSKRPSKSKIEFYNELIARLSLFTEEERRANREEIRSIFCERLDYCKVPFVTHAPLQLDARLCTLDKSQNIKADYVINVKLLNSDDRVEFPLDTSSNGLRRLSQYKNCSPKITLHNQLVKVTVPVKKKVQEVKADRVVGTDMGITDLLFTSDNKRYGSFAGMNILYENILEPKLKRRSNLRNKMRSYQKELASTMDPERRNILELKIFNIAIMLNGQKNLNKCKRRYAHAVELKIGEAVKGLIGDIKSNPALVAMESLDITEFDRGRQANKRDSSWVRGELAKRVQSALTWHGIPYVEVDPAYTSKACPNCHNIDADNRKYKSFECTVCRHKSDADYNASINIANRAFDKEIAEIVSKYRYCTRKRHTAIKELFRERHEKWLSEYLNITVAV